MNLIRNFTRPYYYYSNINKNLNLNFKIIGRKHNNNYNNNNKSQISQNLSRQFSTFRSYPNITNARHNQVFRDEEDEKEFYNDNEKKVYNNNEENFYRDNEENVSANANIKAKGEEGELEEIDRSQYPELFPSEEELNQYYDEEREHNDADDVWFVDPAYENPQEERIRKTKDDQDNQNKPIDEFIPLWQRKAANISSPSSESSQFSHLSSSFQKDNLLHPSRNFLNIVRHLEEDGIENITLIDVRQKCDFADWIIIGEGKSTRHLGGSVDGLYKMFNANSSKSSIKNYPIVEGRDSEDWMLIDTGSIFVHLFTTEARKYRDIEEGLRRITKNMEREFRQFDPKLSRRPPLPKYD
ncbi:9694_t:CDS:2 [Diversispora eburnea]|uniref:9694_t:CDS:1 n=1 Tax=Diversispora eburnea TaxID=1213867 RepID=A0A9N8WPP1_9GLOM|nr:9694_t:CDS:2 [Diversispora eburnea]